MFMWGSVGNTCSNRVAIHQGVAEIEKINICLYELDRACGSFGEAFRELRRLSIGAIFGGQEGVFGALAPWEDVPPDQRDSSSKLIWKCRRRVERSFSSCEKLSEVCFRGFGGPLCPQPAFQWDTRSNPLFNFHFDFFSSSPAPAAALHPTQWLLEDSSRGTNYNEFIHYIRAFLEIARKTRKQLGGTSESHPFDLGIYASSDNVGEDPLSRKLEDYGFSGPGRRGPVMERSYTKETVEHYFPLVNPGRSEDKARGTGGGGSDMVSLHCSLDSPTCLACGWEAERP